MEDFPLSTTRPYVFGWPTGRSLTYFQARDKATAARTSSDLVAMATSCVEAGASRLHFVCHSMGVHVLLHAMQSADLRGAMRGGAGGGARAPAVLASCVLIGPDYPLRRFVQRDYVRLRALCEHLTIYADANDGALWLSELFNRDEVLGKRPFGLKEGGRGHAPSPSPAPASARSRT